MPTTLSLSPVLDVALGMCLLFALTSTCASAFAELVETWVRRRSKILAQGVSEVLGALASSHALLPEIVKAFYESPFISSLYRGQVQYADADDGHVAAERGGTLPAYIPPERFARALLDLAQRSTGGVQEAYAQLVATFTAGVPVEEQIKHLSALFEDSTQRMAGWYRRRVQWVLLITGFVLAAALNLDAIRWLHVLSTQDAVRAALVSQADKLQQLTLQTAQSTLQDCQPPDQLSDKCEAAEKAKLKSATDVLAQSGLPIGWNNDKFWPEGGNCQGMLLAGLNKLLGLFITALATCMGAPFWFDLLNRVTQLRSVVKPINSST